MRHLKAGRTLSRSPSHRRALFRNLTISLVEHGKIVTTLPKAKEVRPFVEKLITLAKDGSLHARRRALAILPDKETIRKLFQDVGPRFADRQGGYTRIMRLSKVRLGDAGATAVLELLKAGETREKAPEAVEPTVSAEE